MSELPIALYRCQDVKQLDQQVMARYGLCAYTLMCRAGAAAWALLCQRWPNAHKIIVFCGPGNNGGDGFVLARLAKAQGVEVTVYENAPDTPSSTTRAQARADWLAYGGCISVLTSTLGDADVIVDALLGTGFRTPLSAALQAAIGYMNDSQHPILSLDIPSGINADTGNKAENAVKATATLTFIGLKIGLLTGPAIDYVGDLYFDNLNTLLDDIPVVPAGQRIDYPTLITALPPLTPTSHKNSRGSVLVIGGGEAHFAGAACLAGEAALRAGAGLVSLVVAPESMSMLTRAPKELICYDMVSPVPMLRLQEKAHCTVIGPGLTLTPWGKTFFDAALQTHQPLVVDADALRWLAQFPQRKDHWILTPHPGEAAALLNTTVPHIQENRIAAAQQLQTQYGGVIVLKGAGTVVATQEKTIAIQAGGCPSLSTAGTGDVLAGLIGALVAQDLPLSLCALLGVSVHTQAAFLQAQTDGARGMIASDLLLSIRALLNPPL